MKWRILVAIKAVLLPVPKPLAEPSVPGRPVPPVDLLGLLQAVVLATLVPWRVFPIIRRMRLWPLVIIYFTRRTSAVALWLVAAAIPAAAITGPIFRRVSTQFAYPYYWEKVLLWTGMAGLLAGLWFSRRIRTNALYLAQHALVPGVCIGGLLYAILQMRFAGALALFPGTPYLPLGLIALAVTLLLLARVYRLMLPSGHVDDASLQWSVCESENANDVNAQSAEALRDTSGADRS